MNLSPIMAAAVSVSSCAEWSGQRRTGDYPIKPVEFNKVRFTDGFWKPRLDTNLSVTLPANFKKSEETGGSATLPRRAAS